MAIAMPSKKGDDPLSTVAVVPFDLASSSHRSSQNAASVPASAARSANSLASAAANLISAIAQGSSSLRDEIGALDSAQSNDDASDEGSSSFTYTAPPQDLAANTAAQQQWYASTPYHISNRYYEADITLKATKAALLPNDVAAEESVLAQPFPAYLVVVDRSRSLEHHRLLASNLETKVAAGFNADISIVAGLSLLSGTNSQVVTALDDEQRSSSTSRNQGKEDTMAAKTSDVVALYADFGWEFIAIDDMDGGDGVRAKYREPICRWGCVQ